MTQRLSKLAECLYSDSYEMAVELHQKADRRSIDQPEDVQLLLAKAYFVTQNYQVASEIAARLKSTRNHKIAYQSHFLEFKALYLSGTTRLQILQSLKTKIKSSNPPYLSKYLKEIDDTLAVVSNKETNKVEKSAVGRNERREFQQLLKAEDDNSIVMEGMPMFLVSQKWYEAWQDYTNNNQKFQKQKQHPGPITQFDIVDHLYNVFFDSQSHKDYTNRYLLANSGYKLFPKKCWIFLKDRYGGIEVKRYNISFIDKPYQIIAEVNLKRIEIARFQKDKTEQLNFLFVQITKKENWEGLKNKLANQWGAGQICHYDGKSNKAVTQTQNFEEIDTLGKKYVYLVSGKAYVPESKEVKVEKCGNRKCNKTGDLRNCECKTIKFCNLECLKQEWKYHKAKHQIELEHLRRKPVTFKEFNLQEKAYGGRKGVVGLKNLGNTCYMNSGLQCLSNTKQITDYFMKDEFKSHINHSNPLGTKGNLACSYAQLIREMWTGSNESLAPVKLKKKIGDFATQFSGYGQQDSQEFISYLIDGLQQDLNLVKKKQNFEVGDEIKPDEQMSRESEYNFSKRIQSYIRNLMVGQFKSTVICSSCQKISVCFDPYMLLSLPIPSSRQWTFFFLSSNIQKGALKMNFTYSSTTTLQSLSRQFVKLYNEKYYREIKEGSRQKLIQERIFYITINSENFEITKILEGKESINAIYSSDILFFLQVPFITTNQELIFCQYELNAQRSSYPRILKLPKNSNTNSKDLVVYKSLQRGLEKGANKSSYQELVLRQKLTKYQNLPFKSIMVECKKKLKLSTFVEGYNEGFGRKLSEADQAALNLQDCLKGFTHKEKLEKENSWYCNKCKEFKQATKQMEIYKTNKILVMAFKRFSRHSKITLPIKFPVQGLDIGPFVLSNRNKEPLLYDLYGVVNHHGSLYGGHYTAYCQNFLNKRWYEFNDSRVSEISRSEIVTGYAYVLFYRRRDK